MRPSTGLRATNSGCRVVLRVLRSLRSKNRGWRERGASLEDAQAVLPWAENAAEWGRESLSAAIKKLKKSQMRVFFDLYNTVMLHRSILFSGYYTYV